MAQVVETVMLEVGGECWREKLVGIATDGARKHAGTALWGRNKKASVCHKVYAQFIFAICTGSLVPL
jgi:hypothetical protein